jgi:hypothetical protein
LESREVKWVPPVEETVEVRKKLWTRSYRHEIDKGLTSIGEDVDETLASAPGWIVLKVSVDPMALANWWRLYFKNHHGVADDWTDNYVVSGDSAKDVVDQLRGILKSRQSTAGKYLYWFGWEEAKKDDRKDGERWRSTEMPVRFDVTLETITREKLVKPAIHEVQVVVPEHRVVTVERVVEREKVVEVEKVVERVVEREVVDPERLRAILEVESLARSVRQENLSEGGGR